MTRLVVALAVITVLSPFGCNKDATTVDDSQPTGDTAEAIKPVEAAKEAAPTPAPVEGYDHSAWDALLDKYVTEAGLVDYKGWKADTAAMASLDAYLGGVAKADISGLGRDAQLAFLINAYNAYCAKAVLAEYPLKSVMDVKGFFDAKKYVVAGEEFTLNDLENKKIREGFGEARIHFVVNCASGSCPRIAKDALTHKNLEKLMEQGAVAYVQKETKLEGKKVTTSKIFEWFKDDFVKSAGSVNEFLAKYVPDDQKEAVKTATVTTREYDWSLNEAK